MLMLFAGSMQTACIDILSTLMKRRTTMRNTKKGGMGGRGGMGGGKGGMGGR